MATPSWRASRPPPSSTMTMLAARKQSRSAACSQNSSSASALVLVVDRERAAGVDRVPLRIHLGPADRLQFDRVELLALLFGDQRLTEPQLHALAISPSTNSSAVNFGSPLHPADAPSAKARVSATAPPQPPRPCRSSFAKAGKARRQRPCARPAGRPPRPPSPERRASGSGRQTAGRPWLTESRLRALTVALLTLAVLIAAVRI